MSKRETRTSLRGEALRASAALTIAASLLGGCLGGGGDPPVAMAPCSASMADNGTVTLPQVAADDGTFAYTLTPNIPKESPMQYTVTRQAPADAGTGCAAIAYSQKKGDVLVARGIQRGAQMVTLSFRPVELFDDQFRKVAGQGMGTLMGNAGGDTPIANATVVVSDAAGATIGTTTTNGNGAFSLHANLLPDTVKVVATGGTRAGVPFVGSLKAEMANYTSIEKYVSIQLTPVTTLVAAYRERYPAVSLDEAMQRVRQQLGIPDNTAIDADDQASPDNVDDTAFFAAASAAGSVDMLVQSVLADWEQGTPHDFAPAAVVMDDAPTILQKEVSLVDELGSLGGPAVKAATQVWSYYKGKQTEAFQAETLKLLREIKTEVNQLSKKMDLLLQIAINNNYKTTRAPVEPWEERLRNAYNDMLTLVSTTRVAQGSCAAVPTGMAIADDDYMNLSDTCRAYADDVIWERNARQNIDAVVDTKNFNRPWDLFNQKVAAADGLLALYKLANMEKISPDNLDITKHKFYTFADSRLLWEHYRYWENQTALLYFFYAGFYNYAKLPTQVADAKTRYDALVAKEAALMPAKQLPFGMYVDPYHTDYYGTVVGTPMVWWVRKPNAVRDCYETVTYTPLYIYGNTTVDLDVQRALRQEIACYQARPEAGGLTGWRLATLREWEAFTLTSGKPGSKSVGVWLAERGMTTEYGNDGIWFNDKRFYATESVDCPKYYGSYAYAGISCSSFTYYFRFIDPGLTWQPYIWFDRFHTANNNGTVGYVMPVRPTVKGEFY